MSEFNCLILRGLSDLVCTADFRFGVLCMTNNFRSIITAMFFFALSVRTYGAAPDTANLDSAYLADTTRRIQRAWFPPAKANKDVIVACVIQPDGKVSGIKVLSSSGSKLTDEAAISSIERAAPMRKLPNDRNKPIELRLKFHDPDVIVLN